MEYKAVFELFQKLHLQIFMHASSWHLNCSTFICPFVSGKCGMEGKKLQKLGYLENEKSFLDEIKNTFHSFGRAIIWWKNEKLIKNRGHKLEGSLVTQICIL